MDCDIYVIAVTSLFHRCVPVNKMLLSLHLDNALLEPEATWPMCIMFFVLISPYGVQYHLSLLTKQLIIFFLIKSGDTFCSLFIH